MIIQYDTDGHLVRVVDVQQLQESDELETSVTIGYQAMHMAGHQIDTG